MILLLFILLAICTFIWQLFLPWWSICLVTIPLAFIFGRNFRHVVLSAIFSCGIVWFILALCLNEVNGSLMTSRIAVLFSAPSNLWLFIGCFVIAGLTGGISAAAGFSLRRLYGSNKPKVAFKN
ncbi:MAG: hypothetical protein H0V65_07085 [Chitinophagales bacterium]|jgi:hypothetical protein|nr:hypothetical protein [Chitinophagales bacterium]